jgi:hypothetical protein
MTLPHPRRHGYPVLCLIILALISMRSIAPPAGIQAAGASQQTEVSRTPSQTSHADPPSRTVPCRTNVYPFVPWYEDLEERLPNWYQPVTMASIGLPADADNAAIPALNTTTPQSPRFRVPMYERGQWVLWISSDTVFSSPLIPMLAGPGNLSAGFQEANAWIYEHAPPPPVNYVLEAGDWLTVNYPHPLTPLSVFTATLNQHRTDKTLMILPIYDNAQYSDAGHPWFIRIQRFIQVRLLDYAITEPHGAGYLEFALVDNQKVCLATTTLALPRIVRGVPPSLEGTPPQGEPSRDGSIRER